MQKKQPEARIKRFRPRSRTPILITEVAQEFDEMLRKLEAELEPRGIIEEKSVERIAQAIWEIRRYERAKSTIVNVAYRDALRDLLSQVGVDNEESGNLSERWFTDAEAKSTVEDRLREVGLDENAIEAEALRRSLDNLQIIEKMIGGLEARVRNGINLVFEYRNGANKSRGLPGRFIEGERAVRSASK
jgi:hypothetical protein